jgi:hypothetical protein
MNAGLTRLKSFWGQTPVLCRWLKPDEGNSSLRLLLIYAGRNATLAQTT